MGSLIVALLGVAMAAPQLTVLAPRGEPAAGEAAPIWVAVSEDGRALAGRSPTLSVSEGDISAPIEREPGLWEFVYSAPLEPGPIDLSAALGEGRGALTLSVLPPRPPALVAPPLVVGSTGQPVSLVVTGRPGLSPEDLWVTSPEGRITEVRAASDGLHLTWIPGDDPFPRAVPIGLRDRARAAEPPVWVVVQLRGRARIPVQTEPGSKVTLKVGGRAYGPFPAGADGVANTSVEVRPGEETAEVLVQDDAGNTTRSTLALGGAPHATLALFGSPPLQPGRAAWLYLDAVDSEGRPWRGAAPRCSSTVGQPAVEPTGPGQWTLRLPGLPEAALFDVRVECAIEDQAGAVVVIPVERALPSRVVLRIWPEELSADSPVAQVLVTLENRLGERVPGEGLQLSAERGAITLEPGMEAGALRASYDGGGALAEGEDRLTASWHLPIGKGPLTDLALSAAAPPADGGPTHVAARALNAAGLPLSGVEVTLTAGGTTVVGETGPDGWARAELSALPGQPLLVEARAGGVVRRGVTFIDRALGAPSTRPDLVAERTLSIREGRVREIRLSANPPTLIAGAAGAQIQVSLLDRGGHPITDISPHLSASEGTLSNPVLQPDGAWIATYTPPPALVSGEVELTATGAEGTPGELSGSTLISVVPRSLSRAPGMNAGVMVGTTGQPSVWFDLEFDQRLPWTRLPLVGRFSLGTYALSATGEDDLTGAEAEMDLRVFPASVGVLARAEGRRNASWIGVAALVAPYQLEVRLDSAALVQGPGLTPPGLEAVVGASLRNRSGELQFQARYLGLSMGDTTLGWRGGVGGLVTTLGYKLIY